VYLHEVPEKADTVMLYSVLHLILWTLFQKDLTEAVGLLMI
jgi:hypothetical protein